MAATKASWIEDMYFFASRRRHTRLLRDWSSDMCSSDLLKGQNPLLDSDPGKYGFARDPIPQARLKTDRRGNPSPSCRFHRARIRGCERPHATCFAKS